MNNEPIKSPYSDQGKVVNIKKVERTLTELVKEEDMDGCLYFFLPKGGRVILGTMGFCGHQLVKIAELIKEKGEEQIERDGEHDCQP